MISVQRLLWCGRAGPVMFVAGYLIQDALKPGFDPFRQFISHLSLGPYGWVNSALLVVAGGLVVVFSLGLRQLRQYRGAVWMPVMVFGAAVAAAGVFAIDPGLGYPPGATAITTLHGRLHDVAGGVALLAVVTAMLLHARRLRGNPQWPMVANALRGIAVVIVLLFVATSMLAGLDYAGTPGPRLAGLVERAYLTAAFGWLFVVAGHAIRSLSPDNDHAVLVSVRRPSTATWSRRW
jgi:hypothetical protein